MQKKQSENKFLLQLAALKPRNPFAALGRQRAAGSHTSVKRTRGKEEKDLVQRLREAGL
ncbi:hypothetical protein [Piscinibacter gummiphilus]|jgi:hypothetical protein|uniref:hypothetical protein n=1 Tax=Piscinibacter gummiphilus TaxID=946333 RepID=UPI00146FA719|nr:hypothetical protein [Piscinibacter gummiphilus]GLS93173.1 hypothetical protein GCM10007918_04640 [Piscinibacter gummiphilus]